MLKLNAVVIALLAFTQAAHAYVPPSFFVIRMLARKHANIDDTHMRNKVTVYKKNGEVYRAFTETLSMNNSDHVTTRINDETGNEVITRTRKLIGSRAADIERPVAYDLLLLKDGASIYEHFKALGLPLRTEADLYSEKEGSMPYKPENTVSFVRYENRVVVAVGEPGQKADAPSRSTSLWVEKDSFLPLRAVFPTAPEAGMASEPLEYRFSGYQPYKNFLFPRTTQVFKNGALWVKIETLDIKPGAGGALEESKGKADMDGDLRDFVETYFRWIR